MNFQYGRELCNHLPLAASREWLVTNGIGGYASGTISGILTRRYHGLLVAALKPPVARTLFLTKLEETVAYNGQLYDLSANLWADGTVAPQGHLNIESFSLEGTTPVWHFAFADGLLEKRIWMQQGENTTYIHYSYLRGSQPLSLSLKTLLNYRDHHQEIKGKSLFSCQIKQQNLIIQAYPDAPKLYLSALETAQNFNLHWETNNTWYRNFALAVEKERGLNDIEDHFLGATGNCILQPGASLTIIATTENNTPLDAQVSLTENNQTAQKLRDLWSSSHSNSQDTPPWIEQLVLAADQFIVNRALPNNPDGKTIIAGYPWFTDWGRDTMIALPGLTLATGRYDIAKTILCTFAEYIDRGMLPNVFPDAGETPHYNTVDATLWYLEAIRAYYAATEDRELIAQLFPLITDIIDWHIKGTRHNIQMDDDGLLYAGEAGVQLTWMDAKVKGWVVTPRIGKPVEINALWYNALVCLNYFGAILDNFSSKYQAIAEKTRANFAKFWYQEGGYCYDVIDSPTGNDPSFRPNQIFAVSLPSKNFDGSLALLQTAQQKMVVDKVAQKLLTSYGLRSLSTDHLNYTGIYSGNLLKRDASYHQGTTWSWLIGHFVQAHLQIYNNPQLARSFLLPIADHLNDAAIGNISEIFDGDTPFSPRGCFAQAWSVAEVLRSWKLTSS